MKKLTKRDLKCLIYLLEELSEHQGNSISNELPEELEPYVEKINEQLSEDDKIESDLELTKYLIFKLKKS